MSTKKTDVTETEEVTEEVAETEVTKEEVDPFSIEEEIFIPTSDPKKDPSQFFAINGRTFVVQKNKKVKVPKPVADLWNNSVEQQALADELDEAAQSK